MRVKEALRMNNNKKTAFNLGYEVNLIFNLVACTENKRGEKSYHHCESWNPEKSIDKTLYVTDEATIVGKYGHELGILVKNDHGRLMPFLVRNRLKKFSSRTGLTVVVEDESLRPKRFVAFHKKLKDGTIVLCLKTPKEKQNHQREKKGEPRNRRERKSKQNHQQREIIYDPFESRQKRRANNTYKKAKQNPAEQNTHPRKSQKKFRIGTPLGKYPGLKNLQPVSQTS